MQKADEVVPASATNQKPKASCDEVNTEWRRPGLVTTLDKQRNGFEGKQIDMTTVAHFIESHADEHHNSAAFGLRTTGFSRV
jgi:hypothetical protein